MSHNKAKINLNPPNPSMIFRKSSFCNGGACVTVAIKESGDVVLRSSKQTDNPTLHFTRSEWIDFIKGVKNNEFDVTVD